MINPKQKQDWLTRDEFRNSVFKRDNHKCVVCGEPATFNSEGKVNNLDAHHIVERRLFGESQGYYLDNGATVCVPCHYKCEQTIISCETLREKCGIKNVIYPKQFYREATIDKWGNYILPNGNRLRGELYYDHSVQKILEPFSKLFSPYVKYPRTFIG